MYSRIVEPRKIHLRRAHAFVHILHAIPSSIQVHLIQMACLFCRPNGALLMPPTGVGSMRNGALYVCSLIYSLLVADIVRHVNV